MQEPRSEVSPRRVVTRASPRRRMRHRPFAPPGIVLRRGPRDRKLSCSRGRSKANRQANRLSARHPLQAPRLACAAGRRCRVACRRRFALYRWVVARALCRRQSMFSPRLDGRDMPLGLHDEPQPAKRGGFGRALRRRRPHTPPASRTELIHTSRAVIEAESAAVVRTGRVAGRSIAVRVGSRSVVYPRTVEQRPLEGTSARTDDRRRAPKRTRGIATP